MHRIIYLSTAIKMMSEKELNLLLEQSRSFNLKNNITGVLLYMDGDFIQVLEGEKEVITSLFDNIKKDNRHKGIICVFDSTIKKKQFPDWSMGFEKIKYDELRKTKGFESIDKEYLTNSKDKTALIFLVTFIKSHIEKIMLF